MPLNPIQCRKKLKLKAKIASVLGSCCTCLAFARGKGKRKSGSWWVGGWLVCMGDHGGQRLVCVWQQGSICQGMIFKNAALNLREGCSSKLAFN